MFRVSRLILHLAAFVFVAGCTSTHYVGPANPLPTRVESVQTLFQEPKRPYEVLAFVEAKGVTIFATPEGLMEKCREQAANVGADAVIYSTTGKWSGIPGVPGSAAGRAIRWKSSGSRS